MTILERENCKCRIVGEYEDKTVRYCSLHAAAPEILEALKMLLDLYGGHSPDDPREERYEIIARKAIANAERS